MRVKKRERESAYLALPYIILNRAGFWGKHTSEDQSWRSPTRCPKAEGHILRDQKRNLPQVRGGGKRKRINIWQSQGKPTNDRSIQLQGAHSLPLLTGDPGGDLGSLRPWDRAVEIVDRNMIGNVLCCLFPLQSSSLKQQQTEGGSFNFSEVRCLSLHWTTYDNY